MFFTTTTITPDNNTSAERIKKIIRITVFMSLLKEDLQNRRPAGHNTRSSGRFPDAHRIARHRIGPEASAAGPGPYSPTLRMDLVRRWARSGRGISAAPRET